MRQAGKQAAVLANQHFIFPIDTCTDVTNYLLTLMGGGGPTHVPEEQVSFFLPRTVRKPLVSTRQEHMLTTPAPTHVLWDPALLHHEKAELGQGCSGAFRDCSNLNAELLA